MEKNEKGVHNERKEEDIPGAPLVRYLSVSCVAVVLCSEQRTENCAELSFNPFRSRFAVYFTNSTSLVDPLECIS